MHTHAVKIMTMMESTGRKKTARAPRITVVVVVVMAFAFASVNAQRSAEEVRPVSGTVSKAGNHSAWDVGRAPCEDNLLAITADNTYVDLEDDSTLSILGLELEQGVIGGILIGQESVLEIAPPSVLEASATSACPSLRNVNSRMTTPTSISISWEGNNADADFYLSLNEASMPIYPTDVTDSYRRTNSGDGSDSAAVVWHWASDVEYSARQEVSLHAVVRDSNGTAAWATTHEPVQRAVQWSDQLVQDPDASVWSEDTAWAPRVPCESDHTLLRERPDKQAYEVDIESTIVVSSLQLEKGAGISLGTNGVLELGNDDGSTACEMDMDDPVFTPPTTTTAPETTTPAAPTTKTPAPTTITSMSPTAPGDSSTPTETSTIATTKGPQSSSSAAMTTMATITTKDSAGKGTTNPTDTAGKGTATTTTTTISSSSSSSSSTATSAAGGSTPSAATTTMPSPPGPGPSGSGNSTTTGSASASPGGASTAATVTTTPATTTSSTTVNGGKTDESSSTSASIIPAAAGAGGGALLLVVVVAFLVVRSRKRRRLGPVPDRKTVAPAMFDNPAYVGSQSEGDALEPNVLYESGSAARDTEALEPNVLYESGSAASTTTNTAALGQEPNVLYEGSGKPAATDTLPVDYETVPENDYQDPVYAVAGQQHQQPRRPQQQRRLQSNPAYMQDEHPLGFQGAGFDDVQA